MGVAAYSNGADFIEVDLPNSVFERLWQVHPETVFSGYWKRLELPSRQLALNPLPYHSLTGRVV